jgi:hypothetical protein
MKLLPRTAELRVINHSNHIQQRLYARLLLYRLAQFSQFGESSINTRNSLAKTYNRGKKSSPYSIVKYPH